jgi:F-type H+-transporting ATPase subunit b
MLIDWFTVCAQALNFLILVWLLKHFLYKPILRAIDAREKKIAAELADADAKKVAAKTERDEFERKNQEFERQRAALLSKATDEANAEQKRLLDEALQAADAMSAKRQESLRNDAHNLNQAISRRTQQEVFAIARKALTDLATVSLEERMGEVFTRRLREMDGNAKNGLGQAIKTLSGPALVRSAFELPADQRAAIQNAINETFAANVHLRFETSPDLVSGIELTANGQKVAWSIADYLSSLENSVAELLKREEKPEPKPEIKPVAKTAPEPDAKAAPKPEPTVEPRSASAPVAEAKPKADVQADPKAVSEPAAEAKPRNEPKIPNQPVANPEPVAESKAAVEPVAKAEPVNDPKAASDPVAPTASSAAPKTSELASATKTQ